MSYLLGVVLFLLAVSPVAAQSLRSNSSGAGSPSGTVILPPSVPVPSTSGRAPVRAAPGTSSAVTTPFTLSGETVCSRGTVTERPGGERASWFDGALVGLPGYRCITLQ